MVIDLILQIYFCRYLKDRSVSGRDFNSYGSRRGNDDIMSRGTFANIRLVNKLNEGGKSGPKTLHIPSNKIMDIFDAAKLYIEVCTTALSLKSNKSVQFGCSVCLKAG